MYKFQGKIKVINDFHTKYESRMEFDFSGINYVLLNTIRRIAMSDIPVYAFNNITINKNDSVFDNTYLKLRLQNMAVKGIKYTEPILSQKII